MAELLDPHSLKKWVEKNLRVWLSWTKNLQWRQIILGWIREEGGGKAVRFVSLVLLPCTKQGQANFSFLS